MTRLLIIIPVDILDSVKAAGGGAFVSAGSPTGESPATHWWQAGKHSDAEVEQINALYAGFPAAHVEEYSLKSQAGRPWDILTEMGLKPLISGGRAVNE